MRLFFAVELEPPVRAAAAAAGRQLAEALAAGPGLDARWIPADNLHVTLWFLGEVHDTARLALEEAVAPPLDVAPFELRVAGFGMFPPSGPPRVIWMGVEAPGGALHAVHAVLGRRLSPLGFEAERRPYRPHLTLARVRERPSRESAQAARRLLAAQAGDAGVSRARAVTLFRSRLSPKGAAYAPVLRVPLGA